MGKYIIKRLLQLIPVLIGITFLSFAMMRLAGGDAVTYMYENTGSAVSQEVIDKAKAEYGLDKPFLVQYAAWFAGMVTGDMGESLSDKIFKLYRQFHAEFFCCHGPDVFSVHQAGRFTGSHKYRS